MILTPRQCRAARGLLKMSQAQLASEAEIALSSLRDFETDNARRPASAATVNALAATLERLGVVLIAADRRGGEGVRLR